jgi:putative phosphotransacetylase
MSNYKVTIGLSNKHLHLSAAHIDVLFGAGHKLTPTKDLRQPGQFACEEKVDLEGPKGVLKGLRVLGPARGETQIELSLTDARSLGIKAPVRESGKLAGTPGCKRRGPRAASNSITASSWRCATCICRPTRRWPPA